MRKVRKRHKAGKGIVIGLLLFLLFLIGGITLGAFYVSQVYKPKAIETVEHLNLTHFSDIHASKIYYKNKKAKKWKVMETLYSEQENRWVPYKEIPSTLVNATVAIEDKRFWEHRGVDWKRTFSAFYEFFIKNNENTHGGSTITQQLMKNLTQHKEITKERKILEILEALEFEKKHDKEEILELYFNNIYYGNQCTGVYRATKKYFDKEVKDLTLVESALLIAIPNNPEFYNPYKHPTNTKERAAIILCQMYDQDMIYRTELDKSLAKIGYTVSIDPENKDNKYNLTYNEKNDSFKFKDGGLKAKVVTDQSGHVYSWYTDAVLDKLVIDLMDYYECDEEQANRLLYEGGLRIYTCLDTDVQKVVDQEYKNRNLTENNRAWDQEESPQSAITVIDNKTGKVVALSGGLGKKTTSRAWNRAVDTKRPSGSSIKPLSVYAPAVDLKKVTPNTIIEDSMFKLDPENKPWPVNADGVYRGHMTIRDAVANSVNTVAVKTLDKVGLDKSFDYVTNKFHLTTLSEQDKDYAPLALGGFTDGVTTYEMASAFSVFPRKGEYIEPYLYSTVKNYDGEVIIEHGKKKEHAITEDTAYTMTSMLKDVVLRGTGGGANLGYMESAGKTGTTSNAYDLWFCGYTPYYTAAVWTGYDTQIAMGNEVSNPSVSIWYDVMSQINSNKTPVPLIPEGYVFNYQKEEQQRNQFYYWNPNNWSQYNDKEEQP